MPLHRAAGRLRSPDKPRRLSVSVRAFRLLGRADWAGSVRLQKAVGAGVLFDLPLVQARVDGIEPPDERILLVDAPDNTMSRSITVHSCVEVQVIDTTGRLCSTRPLDHESLRRKAHSRGQPQGRGQSANYVDALGPRKPRSATGHSQSIAIVPVSPDFLARNKSGVDKHFPHGDNRS